MKSMKELLPYNWESKYTNNSTSFVTLDPNNDEYKQIKNYFMLKHPQSTVRTIERIENKHAYLSAMLAKERMIFVNKCNPKEDLMLKKVCPMCQIYFIKYPNEILDNRKKCDVCLLNSTVYLVCGEICAMKAHLYPKYLITINPSTRELTEDYMLQKLISSLRL